jgi:cytochrome c oxidase subunit 4
MDTTQGTGAGRIGDGHEEPHGHTESLPHHPVPYFLIFGLLVVLTAITVGVAFLEIHNEIAKVLLALTIASIKASAVALFFMHLKFEGKLIYLILIVPLMLCILLVCALIPDIVHSTPFNPLTPLPGASGH